MTRVAIYDTHMAEKSQGDARAVALGALDAARPAPARAADLAENAAVREARRPEHHGHASGSLYGLTLQGAQQRFKRASGPE